MPKNGKAPAGRKSLASPAPLTVAQRDYMTRNLELDDATLAQHTGAAVAQVQDVRSSTPPPPARKSRVDENLERLRPGVVAMTDAASMAADEFYKKGGPPADNSDRWHKIRPD